MMGQTQLSSLWSILSEFWMLAYWSDHLSQHRTTAKFLWYQGEIYFCERRRMHSHNQTTNRKKMKLYTTSKKFDGLWLIRW